MTPGGSRFWLAAAGLLALMAGVQIASVRGESQTFDEGNHLTAAYTYLRTGSTRFSQDHPPLGRVLNALPLLALGLELPTQNPGWEKSNLFEVSPQFIYRNRVPAGRILFVSRCVTILLTLLLGLTIAAWTRRKFGPAAALVALAFYCFEPNLLAHGRYVTTDFVVAAAMFWSVIAWTMYLESGRRRDLVLSGLALAFALLSKFSAVALVPAFLILYAVRWPREPRLSVGRLCVSFAALGAIAVAAIALAYPVETLESLRHWTPMARFVDRSTFTGNAVYKIEKVLHLPKHPYFFGLNEILLKYQGETQSYVLARRFDHAVWYYYPVAFVVKSTTALLIGLILAAATARPNRKTPLPWFAMAVPAVLFFCLSVAGNFNLGIRHLLPVYPFLCVLLGASLARAAASGRAGVIFAAALVLLHAGESLSVYPHYLAFFNRPSGGPANGHRYLLDSNIDWGQDALRLKAWYDAQHLDHICVLYFGRADLKYFGINGWAIPLSHEKRYIDEFDCVAAVSITPLFGLYVPPEYYEWLRRRPPTARIGYSMWIWDLRKPRAK